MEAKMKHKKLAFMIGLCLIIYAIYFFFQDSKINYIALGDSLSLGMNAYGETGYGYSDYIASYLEREGQLKSYSKDFAGAGYRIADLEHQLETNQLVTTKKGELSLKKCLRESQLVTLSIGGNDLLSSLNISSLDIDALDEESILQMIDETLKHLDQLFKQLRKYVKGDIVFIGYYNPFHSTTLPIERIFTYLNYNLEEICQKYDIDFVNTYTLFKQNKDYLPNPTNIHPSTQGCEAIAKQIIKIFENK